MSDVTQEHETSHSYPYVKLIPHGEISKIVESHDPEFVELHSLEFVPTVQTLISEVIYG